MFRSHPTWHPAHAAVRTTALRLQRQRRLHEFELRERGVETTPGAHGVTPSPAPDSSGTAATPSATGAAQVGHRRTA